MKKLSHHLLSCLLFSFTSITALASSTIEFSGKFKEKVILVVDGKTRILKAGQTSPEGFKVINVKGEIVTLDIDGKKKQFKLGESNAITTNYAESASHEVIISLNEKGQFLTAGSINRQVVSLLVDTGANTIALNSNHAKKLGIDYLRKGIPVNVSTASGMTKAYQITLDTVSVGQITLHNIHAVVIEGVFPLEILLGMTFLGNLEIHREQQTMTLKKKW